MRLEGRERTLIVKSGASFDDIIDHSSNVEIGLPETYAPMKTTLTKVLVPQAVEEGQPLKVVKSVIPLLLLARLEESRLRFDEHDENSRVFTVLGSVGQLENANRLLRDVLPEGVGRLEHGTKLSYEDIMHFDNHLNGETRKFLVDRQCGSALLAPALVVDGVVYHSKLTRQGMLKSVRSQASNS